YITWAQHFVTFSRQEFERFEKYLIARYAAFPLLYWIISGEFDESGDPVEYAYHGNVIKQTDPYGHPVSIQPGHSDPENVGTNRIFADESWLDYIVHQLPHLFSGKNFTPEDVNAYILTDRIYNKPVVNDEFGYEQASYPGQIFSEHLVRKYAWAVVMGGGFPSYGHAGTIRVVDLDATDSPGAHYMTNLYTFFEDKPWWEYFPNNALADSGFCLTGPSSELLVYFPGSGQFQVDLGEQEISYHVRWYNPKDGRYIDRGYLVASDWLQFTTPFPHDAVLWLYPARQPEIAVSQDTLLFCTNKGSENPAVKQVTVMNAGDGELSWNAREITNKNWLDLYNTNGRSGDGFTVSVDISNMPVGTYWAEVGISDSNASNSPFSVYVKLVIYERPPELIVNTDSLNFGVNEIRAGIYLENRGEETLHWAIEPSTIPNWISTICPDSGSITSGNGDSLYIHVDRSDLDEGIYTDVISVISNGGHIDIIISVKVAGTPELSVSENVLDFDTTYTEMSFMVENSGSGNLVWKADHVCSWISHISPDSGALRTGENMQVVVSVNRVGLTNGSYEGNIVISSNGGLFQLPVIMKVVSEKPHYPGISIAPHFLDFGADSSHMNFIIKNISAEVIYWTIRGLEIPNWIEEIEPDSGTISIGDSQAVRVSVTRDGLTPGEYNGMIFVIVKSDTEEVNIRMFVPDPPELSVTPTILDFAYTQNSRIMQIRNDGGGVLTWSIQKQADLDWITCVIPDSGYLVAGQSAKIAVLVDRENRAVGEYSGSLMLKSNIGEQKIGIIMNVGNEPFYEKRLNCGSNVDYTDVHSRIWESDIAYSPGKYGYVGGEVVSTVDSIKFTEDDPLFQVQRCHIESYRFDVANGIYEMWLKFAEIEYTELSKRLFDIEIEDSLVAENLDIYSQAGHDAAFDLIYTASVTDGQLNIDFNSASGDPSIAALKISGISPASEKVEMTAPDQFQLYPNYPNPFQESTYICFDLSVSSQVKLTLFNMLGQRIKKVNLGYLTNGPMRVPINAIDQTGRKLPSGIYYYEIEISGTNGPVIKTGKMMLRK
ncbi:DUF4038 domain-containing protein, partial [candidate division KSB1 bacterium]|nr:DUF4038 domain-containing protein [candidate division KSB1 bacterium]